MKRLQKNTAIWLYIAIFASLLAVLYQGLRYPGLNLKIDNEPLYGFNEDWSYIALSPQQRAEKSYAYNTVHARMVNLPDTVPVTPGDIIVLRNVMPKKYVSGMTLRLRTSYQSLRIFIGDQEIYSYDDSVDALGNTQGNVWHFVRVPMDTVGSEIFVEISSLYPQYAGQLNSMTYGSKNASVMGIIKDNTLNILLIVLLVVVALALLCVYFLLRRMGATSKALLYLAIFALLTASWSALDNAVLQISIGSISLVSTLARCLFMLNFIPLLLFLQEAYITTQKVICQRLNIALLSCFAILFTLHISGKVDFIHSLAVYSIIVGVVVIVTIYAIIRDYYRSPTHHVFMLGVGTVMLTFFAVLDLARLYVNSHAAEPIFFTRMGTLLYVCFVGFLNCKRDFKAVVETHSKTAVDQLDFTDTLTGLKNRHACEMELQRISTQGHGSDFITILGINISNLHFMAHMIDMRSFDQIILDSATMVRRIFSERGQCFHVSEGRFLVFLRTCDEAEVHTYLRRLDQSVYSRNINAKMPLTVSTETEVYRPDTGQDIEAVITNLYGKLYGAATK